MSERRKGCSIPRAKRKNHAESSITRSKDTGAGELKGKLTERSIQSLVSSIDAGVFCAKNSAGMLRQRIRTSIHERLGGRLSPILRKEQRRAKQSIGKCAVGSVV